jgi:N-acetylneuraminic acid mutarotase
MAVIALALLLSVILVEGVLDLNNGEFAQVSPKDGIAPNGTAIFSSSGGYVWLVQQADGKTWRYSVDNNQWTQVQAILPLSNSAASDLDDSAGLLFAFGGSTGFGSYTRIYYLRNSVPDQWTQFVDDSQYSGLPPRVAHTMTDVAGVMYLFGGWNQAIPQYYADTWWFDTSSLYTLSGTANWTYSTSPYQPPARNAHTMVDYGGDLWLFGGFSHNVSQGDSVGCANPYDNCIWYNDVWTYNTGADKWMQVYPAGPLPAGRNQHSAAAIGESMYVFGGLIAPSNQAVNDMWAYNFPLQVWKQLSPSGSIPQPGAVKICVALGGKIYYWGSTQTMWTFNPHVNADTTNTEETTSTTGLTAAITLNILLSAAVAVLAYLIYRHTTREPGSIFSDYAPMKEGSGGTAKV